MPETETFSDNELYLGDFEMRDDELLPQHEPIALESGLDATPSEEGPDLIVRDLTEHVGGTPEDWKLTYSGEGYVFDGKEIINAQTGESYTRMIEKDSDPGTSLMHREMLREWEGGGSQFSRLPDHREVTQDGETLYVTHLILNEDRSVRYEIRETTIRYPEEDEASPAEQGAKDALPEWRGFFERGEDAGILNQLPYEESRTEASHAFSAENIEVTARVGEALLRTGVPGISPVEVISHVPEETADEDAGAEVQSREESMDIVPVASEPYVSSSATVPSETLVEGIRSDIEKIALTSEAADRAESIPRNVPIGPVLAPPLKEMHREESPVIELLHAADLFAVIETPRESAPTDMSAEASLKIIEVLPAEVSAQSALHENPDAPVPTVENNAGGNGIDATLHMSLEQFLKEESLESAFVDMHVNSAEQLIGAVIAEEPEGMVAAPERSADQVPHAYGRYQTPGQAPDSLEKSLGSESKHSLHSLSSQDKERSASSAQEEISLVTGRSVKDPYDAAEKRAPTEPVPAGMDTRAANDNGITREIRETRAAETLPGVSQGPESSSERAHAPYPAGEIHEVHRPSGEEILLRTLGIPVPIKETFTARERRYSEAVSGIYFSPPPASDVEMEPSSHRTARLNGITLLTRKAA